MREGGRLGLRTPPVVALLLLVLAGCGGSGVGLTREQRAAEEALKLWSGFPATATPRPVVPVGDGVVVGPDGGFGTGAAKLAFLEGHLALRTSLPKTPALVHGSRVISAKQALKLMKSNAGPDLSPKLSLAITAVQLSSASFATDRGLRRLPAWAFSLNGVANPVYVLALTRATSFTPPATRQLLPSVVGAYEEDHAAILGNGRVIRLTFVGGPAGHHPCDISYTTGSLADNHAVAFWITPHPVKTHGAGVICDAVGYSRTVVLRLAKPLGGRALVDAASGGQVPVSGAR